MPSEENAKVGLVHEKRFRRRRLVRETMVMERVRLRVRGLVQGVWFRASTRDEARRLGLSGWVQNCSDGSVEALAEGPRAQLEALVAYCRQGPPHARVDDVEAVFAAAQGDLGAFDIR